MDQQECQYQQKLKHQQLPDQQQSQQHHQPHQQHFLEHVQNMLSIVDKELSQDIQYVLDMQRNLDRQRFQHMQRNLDRQRFQHMQHFQHNYGSVLAHGTTRPVMANVGTSTSDSCTSRGGNNPIPDHQEDEAVNKCLELKSMVKDLQEENAKLKHLLSLKSQEEDMESYFQEIQLQAQNNLENPALDSSQASFPNDLAMFVLGQLT